MNGLFFISRLIYPVFIFSYILCFSHGLLAADPEKVISEKWFISRKVILSTLPQLGEKAVPYAIHGIETENPEKSVIYMLTSTGLFDITFTDTSMAYKNPQKYETSWEKSTSAVKVTSIIQPIPAGTCAFTFYSDIFYLAVKRPGYTPFILEYKKDTSGIYQRTRSFSAGLNKYSVITAMAADENSLYVADAASRNVLCFTLQHPEKPKFLYAPGALIVPSPYLDITLGADGLLRVVNPGRFRIEAWFPPNHREKGLNWGGNASTPYGFSGCCNPAYITAMSDGRFLTSEKRFIRLRIYDSDGTFCTELPIPEKTVSLPHPEAYLIAASGRNVFLLDKKNAILFHVTTGEKPVHGDDK